ncbi:MAG: transcriptional regulator [Candidatus Thermoplasmatota archaeon]|nr:transcriptional regulator [Candidatus Thermoplasmatota archaeon]MCL5881735.1 transcriptional regulator [Candidatus Thermoplasmatota archaeon]
MDDRRAAVLRKVFQILLREGFNVSDPNLGNLLSFDLIAKRDRLRLIIKILQNIDTFKSPNALEMIRISKLTDGTPLVIGEKAGSGALERGVIYYRHSIPILSAESFSDYVDGDRPCISSGPGGFYVSIDGELLHRRREELGYSIGYLSNKIGVSRRSISLYESGSAVTVDVFLKLEEILREDLRKSINLMEISDSLQMPSEEGEITNEFLREVLEIMIGNGFDFHAMRRAPFDAITKESMREFLLVGLLETLNGKRERIEALRNVSAIFENDAFLVSRTSTERENIAGCPVISVSELRGISEKEQLQRIIEKRKTS